MTDLLQVVTAVDDKERAAAIAARLLEGRLAGCVQVVGPVSSWYWWEGRITTSEEWLCVAKTTAASYHDVEQAIRAIHPYQVPEILAVPATRASADYLHWLVASLRGG